MHHALLLLLSSVIQASVECSIFLLTSILLKGVDVSYHTNWRKKLNEPSPAFFAVFPSGCSGFLPMLNMRFIHCLCHTGNLQISKVTVATLVTVPSKVKENWQKEADNEHTQIQGGEDHPPVRLSSSCFHFFVFPYCNQFLLLLKFESVMIICMVPSILYQYYLMTLEE